MNRPTRTIIVAVLSLLAGACAGRLHTTAQPTALVQEAAIQPQRPDPTLQPLPIRQFNLGEILVPPALAAAPESPACDVTAKIEEVRNQTASVSLNVGTSDYRYTEVRVGRTMVFKDPEKEIILGLLNRDTCTIRLVTITKRGDKLVAPTGYQIEAVRRVNGIRWNNWATEYSVLEPAGWFVIGNEYPYVKEEVVSATDNRSVALHKRGLRSPFDKIDRTITNIFYTPYNQEFNDPRTVAAGANYPMDLARQADDRLRATGVMSLAYLGQLVVAVPLIRQAYVARLLPIEHMDQTEFILDPVYTTDRIFVMLAMNGDRFGTYTCSRAVACGALQATGGTWRIITHAFPSAGLPADFVTGARDPLVSMMFARLLHDYNLAQFRKLLTAAEYEALTADSKLLEEALASAYNTGVNRTALVLKAFFANPKRYTDWTAARGKTSKAHLVAETKGYIAKDRYIRDEWPARLTRTDQTPN